MKKFNLSTLQEDDDNKNNINKKIKHIDEEENEVDDILNKKLEEFSDYVSILSSTLDETQLVIDKIRNIETDKKNRIEDFKADRLIWKNAVKMIENEFNLKMKLNAGIGVAGVFVGAATATMGPTVAMGVASTFGVASTGIPISALSGAAATNAALAWLGGGALSAGGGGMALGNTFLALAGPFGWSIVGASILGGIAFSNMKKNEKSVLKKIYHQIKEEGIKNKRLAIAEIHERIIRIIKENEKLNEATKEIKTFGHDYNSMNENQQYKLGAYVNLMNSSQQLLLNPILSLQNRYAQIDFEKFIKSKNKDRNEKNIRKYEEVIIYLANALYNVELNFYERKIFTRSLQNDKKFREIFALEKNDVSEKLIYTVLEVIDYSYNKPIE